VFQAAGITEESIIVPTPGSIAYTGSFTIPALLLGIGLLVLGGLLLALRRRTKNP
jgi:LPXTG-motif cell wall-anchored protein